MSSKFNHTPSSMTRSRFHQLPTFRSGSPVHSAFPLIISMKMNCAFCPQRPRRNFFPAMDAWKILFELPDPNSAVTKLFTHKNASNYFCFCCCGCYCQRRRRRRRRPEMTKRRILFQRRCHGHHREMENDHSS